MTLGVGGRLGLTVDVELQVDVGDVSLNRARAQEERLGHLAIALASCDQPQDLDLTRGQAVRIGTVESNSRSTAAARSSVGRALSGTQINRTRSSIALALADWPLLACNSASASRVSACSNGATQALASVSDWSRCAAAQSSCRSRISSRPSRRWAVMSRSGWRGSDEYFSADSACWRATPRSPARSW